MLRQTITFLSTLILAACRDPCMPTFDGGNLVSFDEECATGPNTPGEWCPPVAEELECSGPPFPGEMWGQCHSDKTCSNGFTCITAGMGEVCAPACGECGCLGDQQCLGGSCIGLDDGPVACLPACEAGDVCPVDGMICDLSVGLCLWQNT
jgi:hypothetical protein